MNKLPPPVVIKLVQWAHGWLRGLADRFLPPEVRVMLLAGSVMKSMTVHAAARLQIADHLAVGSKSIDDLARATSTRPDVLHRLMRALASEGIFRELADGRFETSAMGQALESGSANSVRPMALLVGDETWSNAWRAATHSIQTGETAFEHVFGQKYFDYLVAHPEAHALFNSWMSRLAELNRPVLEAVFSDVTSGKIVDIGGGHGALINTVLSSNPILTGVVFDLPEVVADVSLDAAVEARCEIVGGSFFESVPKGGDVYVLQQILHDWGDEACVGILKRCRDAMNEGGRVYILDAVLHPGNGPDFNKFMDLHMLMLNHDGQERTEKQFRELLFQAGLTPTRIVPTPSLRSLIEAVPS